MKLSFISIFIFFSLAPSIAFSEVITLVADKWPPYNISPNTAYEGYMVDVAKEIFKKKGINVDYQLMPWSRAVIQTRKGQYNGVIGSSKQEAKDFVFPSEELMNAHVTLFTRKKDSWNYDEIKSLRSVRLGVISGYDYGADLNSYIEKYKNTKRIQSSFGVAAMKQNIQKLQMGRIDVIAGTAATINWIARTLKISHVIKSVKDLRESTKCYIAFSPKNKRSKFYAKTLSDGIKKLRKNGKLAKILAKYGVKDWK